MDNATVHELLDQLGLAANTMLPIEGGWDSWTFDVLATDGSRWIFRFARTPEVAAGQAREARLLPELSRRVSFGIPVPRFAGEWQGHAYVGYAKILGGPISDGDDWTPLAGMLRELHGFPAEEAARLLGREASTAAWRSDYVDLRREFDAGAIPALDAELAAAVRQEYDDFLNGQFDFAPTLVHRDLGAEHVMVDPDTRRPVGLIDFGDAAVGDPAIDFVGALVTVGDAATRELIAAYAGPISWERMRFYWWLGSLHAVRYGVDTGNQEILDDGISGLRERLARVRRNHEPQPQ